MSEGSTIDSRPVSRRTVIRSGLAGVAGLGVSSVLGRLAFAEEPVGAEPVSPPNVILLMSDDQQHTAVGYAGSFVQTPVLDEMAESGLRFDRFYSPAASCAPSRAAFMTGRTPNRTGVPGITWPMNLKERCLPTLFKQRGYYTAHVGKWHLGNDDQGGPVASGYDVAAFKNNKYDDNPRFTHVNCEPIDNQGESSEVSVRYALHFAEQARQQNKPFFITVWFGSPHAPYGAAKQHRELYKDRTEEERNWAAEITGIDAAMGMLRKQLQADNVRDNTLVWFSGDNGHPKGSITPSGIRVPSVAEWPARWKKPRVVEAPCTQMDYLPTFAGLLDVPAAPDGRPIDGLDIIDTLDGKTARRPAPIPFWHTGKHTGHPNRVWQGTSALVDNRFEIYVDNDQTKHLFDLQQDPPDDKRNAAQNPEQVQAMREHLEQFQKSVLESVKKLPPSLLER